MTQLQRKTTIIAAIAAFLLAVAFLARSLNGTDRSAASHEVTVEEMKGMGQSAGY